LVAVEERLLHNLSHALHELDEQLPTVFFGIYYLRELKSNFHLTFKNFSVEFAAVVPQL